MTYLSPFLRDFLPTFVLCYGFHVVRWGLSTRLDLIPSRNGLIIRRNGFQVITNDDFLEEGVLRLITLAYVYIHSLTTASRGRLFGSMVEHCIFDLASRVRFLPKSWDFCSA